jgi:recombinational DNA repair protein RecT
VPYKGICQPIPGWQGIVDLVSRTGRATVWTGAVWNGDEFDYALGDRPFIMHKPGDSHGEGNESQILFFYAVGRVNGADWPITEVWSSARTEKHRNKHNKVGNRHYSFENWEMYGRKVPLLQVCKYMPKSVELQKAMELESAAETGTRVGSIIDGEVEETQSAHRETTPAKQEHDKQQPRKPRAPATNAEKPAEPKTKEQEPAESKTSPEPDESQQSFADDKADDGTAQESAEREPGSDDDLGEDDSPMPDLTFAEAFQAIAKARSADDLDVIRSQIQNLNEKQQANLSVSIENKMKSLASRGSRDGSGLNVE